MSFKETIDSIKDAVKERISSPILGTFTFFVFGFNWQTLVIVWKTELPIEVALQNLETTRITWMRGLVCPAICTVLFCLAYPWFKYWLSSYTDWIDMKRVIKRHDIDVNILNNKKALITTQCQLDEIKESLLREAKRKDKEHEYQLQKQASEFNANAAIDRVRQEGEVEKERELVKLNIEREIKQQRKYYNMDSSNI